MGPHARLVMLARAPCDALIRGRLEICSLPLSDQTTCNGEVLREPS